MTNPAPWKVPTALPIGGTVGIVAPSGPVDPDLLSAGLSRLRGLGFSVLLGRHLFDSEAYLAGRDEDRAKDLTDMLQDPSIHAILAARGGYGSSRLLPLLDPHLPASFPKPLVGFSDITALHLWYLRNRVFAFHGPVVAGGYPWSDATVTSFLSTLTETGIPGELPAPADGPERRTIRPGMASGRLVGGNLSLLTASIGTDYEVQTEDAVVFLEEVGEPAYRIDRMMRHLLHAGKMKSVRALILGEFTDCPVDRGRGPSEIAREMVDELGIPCFEGLAAGHGFHRLVLPLGAMVQVDAGSRTLEVSESVVRWPVDRCF